MAVSRRLRFEILRRDNYTCRYCGAKPPDTELRVDHVKPVALGGKDVPENLVTACHPCNAGKGSIAPNSEFVADVEADALRWKAAVDRAAEIRQLEWEFLQIDIDHTDQSWQAWKTTSTQQAIWRPADWVDTVERFIINGLDGETMTRLIGKTMRNEKVSHDDKWTYFCGCCWREIDEMQEHAKRLIREGIA